MLLNLLTNAVKHQHEGSINVSSEIVNDEESALLRVQVKDHGTGMTEEQLSHAFIPFYKDS